LFSANDLTQRLRDILKRSPVFFDNQHQASGLDQAGTRLALLGIDGKVSVYNLHSNKLEPDTGLSTPTSTTVLWNTAVGFAGGMPVAIRDGVLYSKATENGQKVNELAPPDLRNAQIFPDIAAGDVRLQTWDANSGETDVTTLPIVTKEGRQVFVQSTSFVRLPWTRSRHLPTLSAVSNYAAYLANEDKSGKTNGAARKLTVQSLSDPTAKKVLGDVTSEPERAPSGSSQQIPFVRALTFSQDGSAVISHSTRGLLEVFSLSADRNREASLQIEIPSMQEFAPASW